MKAATRLLCGIMLAASTLASSGCGDDLVVPAQPPAPSNEYDVALLATSFSARQITARSLSDIYAGGNMLLKYNGATWKPIALPDGVSELRHLWQTADGTLWGWQYDFFRYDGVSWDYVASPQSDDGFVAYNGEMFSYDRYGDDGYGELQWFDGMNWHTHVLPYLSGFNIRAMDGTGPDNVYVVGEYGFLAHFNGANWTTHHIDSTMAIDQPVPAPDGSVYLRNWNEIKKWDGSALQDIANPGNGDVRYIAGSPAGVLYAVSSSNAGYLVSRLDNGVWSTVCEPANRVDQMAFPDEQSLLLAYNGVTLYDGSTLRPAMTIPRGSNYYFTSVWGTREYGVFAAGRSVIRYKDGVFTDMDKESASSTGAYAIHGTSASNMVVVGHDMILHYDGQEWTQESGARGRDITDVWVGSTFMAAIAYPNDLLERSGGSWHTVRSGPAHYWAISGWEGGAVAAGRGNVVVRDESGWRELPVPGVFWVDDVWADGPDNIYLCGSDIPGLYHYDGHQWRLIPFSDDAGGGWNQFKITGVGDDVFVSVSDGRVMHLAGSDWTVWPALSRNSFALSALSRNEVFGAGYDGLVSYTRKGF